MKFNFYLFIIFEFIFLVFSISFISATSNVIDVKFSESIYQEVTYNPLQTGSGLYFDANENQSIYSLDGLIIIKNNHQNETVYDTILNISGIKNVYNLSFLEGKNGLISDYNIAGDFVILTIPELPSRQNSTFSYLINKTLIKPPLNFTTGYSSSKIFAGLQVKVTDKVENNLNVSQISDDCISSISIVEKTLGIIDGSNIYNFTFNASSLGGLDFLNSTLSSDNRTLTWNLWSGGCFYSTNNTNLNYDIITPIETPVSDTYKMINTTINYTINSTISNLNLVSINSIINLDFGFEKFQENILTGDNATWKISSKISSNSNISVNLTKVSLWVSQRNFNNTGFTNPSYRDNDTISGADLLKVYTPNKVLNNSQPLWNNSANEWFFNYTYSSSPIVWMDFKNNILSDGGQLINSSFSNSNNEIYIKELYLVTGYWLKITKNITRLADNNYSIFIKVVNLGTTSTPSNQAVIVYNFIPIAFNLTSNFVFSTSTWYSTQNSSNVLLDPNYNGTIYQFGLLPATNPHNSSLSKYGGSENSNNSWSVSFNVTGQGEFAFEDLFLTGVDPLHVDSFGATEAVVVKNVYNLVADRGEKILMGIAGVLTFLLILI